VQRRRLRWLRRDAGELVEGGVSLPGLLKPGLDDNLPPTPAGAEGQELGEGGGGNGAFGSGGRTYHNGGLLVITYQPQLVGRRS
jgi:hypothetical protein